MMHFSEWRHGDAQEHLRRVRAFSADALNKAARDYDWNRYPATVLGWIMAQKSVDMDTAVSAFFNGEPERFNYLHKRDVTPEYQGVCRVLDNICLRVNSGFYLAWGATRTVDVARLRKWVAVQEIDRGEGCLGRWVFDEAIIRPLLTGGMSPDPDAPVFAPLVPAGEDTHPCDGPPAGPLTRLRTMLRR